MNSVDNNIGIPYKGVASIPRAIAVWKRKKSLAKDLDLRILIE